MSTRIGSARIDERGKISGGAAGDQTGNEVGFQNWYLHSKGWFVLRPKYRSKAVKIAEAMTSACNNKRIGYDQAQRNTLFNLVKSKGYDPAKATTNTETDCSALIRVCCHYAGITCGDFTTSNLKTVLLKTGEFVELTTSKYTNSGEYLRKGDILVTRTKGHTVAVVSDGAKALNDPTWHYYSESTEPSVKTILIKTGSWNVRRSPNTTSGIIKVVHGGDTVAYNKLENGWYNLTEGGWISEKAVKN